MAIDTTKNLVGLEEVKSILSVASSDKDDVLSDVINQVSADCQDRYCLRTLRDIAYVDIRMDGSGTDTIVLTHHPVTAISKVIHVKDGDNLTVEDDYVWYADGRIILHGGVLFPLLPRRGVTVSYNAGYAITAVPHDLRAAVLEAIAFRFTERDKKRFGVDSLEMAEQRSVYTQDQYPKHVLEVWDRYRTPVVG